ncbi:MAG TPA: hypothetical protein VG410_05890 [Solirubrobacteraceae bacterium]|nr:hypothetical protein [Solirubrobacteraceae bacterium]
MLRRIAAIVLLAALLPAGAAARTFHTVLEDDALSLFSTPATLTTFTQTLRWLGVDTLRISAEWKLEAPGPDSLARPKGVALGDPRAYDSAPAMQLLDRAVRAASTAGLQVIIDPAFSAPLWATKNRLPFDPSGDPWFNTDIDVRELAQWEGMLAKRYSGSYVPAGQTTPLPRVLTFTIWNEPNQQGYEAPQWGPAGTAASADWYRQALLTAYPAIKRASPGATVLIGDTSATGGDSKLGNSGVPPLRFIRQLACVDDQLQPITTGSCANFRTLPGDGWSQHPYERYTPPWIPSGATDPDGAQVGDLGKLTALLGRLVALGRLAPSVANVWLTEQGYESDAQLPEKLWTEPQQATLNAISEYLAWRTPQVQSFSQFLLRDTLTEQTLALRAQTHNRDAAVPGTWTTGLERENGAPKPALAMFRSPVVARPVSLSPLASWLPAAPPGPPAELIEVWGRARPITAPTSVEVQVADGGWSTYRDVGTTLTDANGIFDLNVPVAIGPPALVRFRWVQPGAGWQTSPAVNPVAFPVSGPVASP